VFGSGVRVPGNVAGSGMHLRDANLIHVRVLGTISERVEFGMSVYLIYMRGREVLTTFALTFALISDGWKC
jgi:hypothetical protein